MNIRRDYGKIRPIFAGMYMGLAAHIGRNKLREGEMRELPEGYSPRWGKRTRPYASATVDLYLGPIEFHSWCNNEDSYGSYWRVGPKTIGSHPSVIRVWRYAGQQGISFKWLLCISNRKYEG